MCAGEAGRLLVQLAKGEFISPEISQRMVDILEQLHVRR